MEEKMKCSVCGCEEGAMFINHGHARPMEKRKLSNDPLEMLTFLQGMPQDSELDVLSHVATTYSGGELLEELLLNHPEYLKGVSLDIDDVMEDKEFCEHCKENWKTNPHQLDAYMMQGSTHVLDLARICSVSEIVFNTIVDAYSSALQSEDGEEGNER